MMPIGTYVQAWTFVIMVLLAPEAFSFACLDFAELENAWLRVGRVAMMLHFQLRRSSGRCAVGLLVHATWLVDRKRFSDCIFLLLSFLLFTHSAAEGIMDGGWDGWTRCTVCRV